MKINIIVAGRFHVEQLSRILIGDNHDVKIYSSSPGYLFPKSIQSNVFFVPMPFQIVRKVFKVQIPDFLRNFDLFIFDLLVSLLMRKPDVIYGFASTSLICGRKYKNSYYVLDRACPHITFQNKILENESRNLQLPFKKENSANTKRALAEYAAADAIFVPSIYSSNSFQEHQSLSDKIYITHLGCNGNFQYSANLNEHFTIGFIGENPLRKGLIYLLRASQKCSTEDYKFLLRTNLDQFKDHEETQSIISNKNIDLLDYLENIEDFYNACDIVCLPSIDEGWGMVTLEALAHGKPIIVTTNVGSSSLIKNNFNGFVIEPFSDIAITEKISLLANDPELTKNMQHNAKASYDAFLSSDESYEKKISSYFNKLSINMQRQDFHES